MKIKYIYSACIEIDCSGFKILTDPWFTNGAFDGSWYQFPEIDPFDFISKPNLIYISHIHPDHYDPIFLKKLTEKFGEIDIIIPDLTPNYLQFKGKSDNLGLKPTRHLKNSKVELFIEENDTGSTSDIDSALIVKDIETGKVLLNLNDCVYNQPHVEKLKKIISNLGGKLDFMALAYTGAGAYPQTYIDIEGQKDLLVAEAENKKQSFFDKYKRYTDFFDADINLPFAGEYILGGRLHYLNEYRGVADAVEVKELDKRAIVLSNGGTVDLVTGEIFRERNCRYTIEDLNKTITNIKDNKFDYEKEVNISLEKINFIRLLRAAALRAGSKSEINGGYNFVFSLTNFSMEVVKRFSLDTLRSSVSEIALDEVVIYEEYSEIIIDYRYLYGLLTTIYHWNNAEIGSHYFTKRVPLRNFKRKVQSYLNFFCIC